MTESHGSGFVLREDVQITKQTNGQKGRSKWLYKWSESEESGVLIQLQLTVRLLLHSFSFKEMATGGENSSLSIQRKPSAA